MSYSPDIKMYLDQAGKRAIVCDRMGNSMLVDIKTPLFLGKAIYSFYQDEVLKECYEVNIVKIEEVSSEVFRVQTDETFK